MIILPLEMVVGTDFFLPIQYQFEICQQTYPIDISGYVVEMQVAIYPFSTLTPPIIDVSSVGGQIVIDGPNGLINIYIPKALVTPYMFGNWNYAISATNAVGMIEDLLSGPFTIKGWC